MINNFIDACLYVKKIMIVCMYIDKVISINSNYRFDFCLIKVFIYVYLLLMFYINQLSKFFYIKVFLPIKN